MKSQNPPIKPFKPSSTAILPTHPLDLDDEMALEDKQALLLLAKNVNWGQKLPVPPVETSQRESTLESDWEKSTTVWDDNIQDINIEEHCGWYDYEDDGAVECKMIALSPQRPDMKLDGSEEVISFSLSC